MIYLESPVRNWPRGVFRDFSMHTNQVELLTLSTATYQDVTGATLSSVATADVDSGLTISNAATADPLWTARLTAADAGDYSFEIVITYSNGEVQRLECVAHVVDP